jgi:hypothetical protein
MYLRCLSVSGQGKQKSSDMRETAIKWDGKQRGIDDIICCEFRINYMDEIMVFFCALPCNLSWMENIISCKQFSCFLHSAI